VEKVARRFYELLAAVPPAEKTSKKEKDKKEKSAPQSPELAQSAEELSRMLIAPASALLGKRRLLVVADGALHYVPFAALPKTYAEQEAYPLVLDHEIVNAPSATTIAIQRQETAGRPAADKLIAVIADPVFNAADERVTGGNPEEKTEEEKDEKPKEAERGLAIKTSTASTATDIGSLREEVSFARLKSTRKEAEEILSYAEGQKVLQAYDFQASRETAMSGELGQYRYVHIATHGFFNTRRPELSGIVLSRFDDKGQARNGFVLTPEIYNLNLPVDMVVLSACQTGLGEVVRGEGIVGITRGLMYAGAARVVVSLWSVADKPTASLMTQFYKGVLKKNISPAAALRAAQVRMWKKGKWESPYYWAGFMIQGEWK
jgi:CHAT domain-containing protein